MKRLLRILLLAVAGLSLAGLAAVTVSFVTGRTVFLHLNDAPFMSARTRYEVELDGHGLYFYWGRLDMAHVYTLPYWALAGIGLLAGWVASTLRERPPVRPGRCANCGYDLRATPDPAGARLAVCPECGAVPAPAQPARPGGAGG